MKEEKFPGRLTKRQRKRNTEISMEWISNGLLPDMRSLICLTSGLGKGYIN
jgi:hypothetical protein